MTNAKSYLAPVESLRVLHVEDNENDAELVAQALRKGGFTLSVAVVQSEAEFEKQLCDYPPDLVLADYNLPQWQGMEALEVLRRHGSDIPLILVSGALGDMTAVECIKRGATDYVLKDGLARLPEAIRRALEEKRVLRLRREAERDLALKVEELARSNADLEQFAYIASHDLQEPLRMVAAYTQLIAQQYRGKLDEKADKFIDYACEGALRMQTLVQDLLAFSRVGHAGAKQVPTNCEAAMAEVLLTLGPAIRESNATVTYSPLPIVLAEPSQMTQLFQNFIGNAIKFQGTNPPHISVRAELTDKNEKMDKEWLFSVSDNGIGIPAESLQTVFEVFRRLHTRSEYAGNGIGLAICKKIIQRNGGKIWVESNVGQGSTFKFTLPVFIPLETTAALEKPAQNAPLTVSVGRP